MDSSLGERLKNRRRELNLTLKALSKKCNISPQLISDYENSRKEPGVKNIKALCKSLEIYPNYLLLEDEEVVNSGKRNTYGYVLKCYLDALEYSKKDIIDINEESKEVIIKINDPFLIKMFTALKATINNDSDFSKEVKKSIIGLACSEEIK